MLAGFQSVARARVLQISPETQPTPQTAAVTNTPLPRLARLVIVIVIVIVELLTTLISRVIHTHTHTT
jgi:hypothetical protein